MIDCIFSAASPVIDLEVAHVILLNCIIIGKGGQIYVSVTLFYSALSSRAAWTGSMRLGAATSQGLRERGADSISSVLLTAFSSRCFPL